MTLLAVLLIMPNLALAASLSPQEVYKDLRQFDGQVGIYAKNLKSRKSLEFHQDDIFPTASTSKLVVAMAVYKYLYDKAPAYKKDTYATDIQYMMTVSDNDSFYELLNELDTKKPDALNSVIKDLRLQKTRIHNEDSYKKYRYHSITTPYEMAKVFENIYGEKYLGKEKSSSLKYNLSNTIFHDEIPRFMLTPVMHKVGQLDNVLCDVGIVDDGRDQILISIYTTTNRSSEYASDFIAATAAKAYNALRSGK